MTYLVVLKDWGPKRQAGIEAQTGPCRDTAFSSCACDCVCLCECESVCVCMCECVCLCECGHIMCAGASMCVCTCPGTLWRVCLRAELFLLSALGPRGRTVREARPASSLCSQPPQEKSIRETRSY